MVEAEPVQIVIVEVAQRKLLEVHTYSEPWEDLIPVHIPEGRART